LYYIISICILISFYIRKVFNANNFYHNELKIPTTPTRSKSLSPSLRSVIQPPRIRHKNLSSCNNNKNYIATAAFNNNNNNENKISNSALKAITNSDFTTSNISQSTYLDITNPNTTDNNNNKNSKGNYYYYINYVLKIN